MKNKQENCSLPTYTHELLAQPNNNPNSNSNSSKELGIISIARGSKYIVSNDVSNGTPSQDIDDVEPNWVVGFEETHILFGSRITSFEMGHTVLFGNLFGHILSLEIEEHEPAQKQGQTSAETDDQRCVQFGFNGAAGSFFGCEFDGGYGFGEGEWGFGGGSEALEGGW
ncbi:unnamed protein product [Camellia sinensis]